MSIPVDKVRTVVVAVNISAAGVPVPNPSFSCNNLGFIPDYVVIREIRAQTAAANVNGNMFLVQSNLSVFPIGVFDGNCRVSNPQTVIPLGKSITEVNLNVQQYSTTNTLGASTMAGDWWLSLTLDFVARK